MAETPLERAKARALRLLERRDYSKAELAAKLAEKGEEPEAAEQAAERMAELGFVNDENYAGMVVRHYAAKGCGRQRIREELRRRRVPRELWDAALEELPDQTETLYRLLETRLRGKDPEGDELRRACAYLVRRGFAWDEVREAAARLSEGWELYE
ncbi:MAG: regulatory protein RecX [Oscillospiraceae bacterium]